MRDCDFVVVRLQGLETQNSSSQLCRCIGSLSLVIHQRYHHPYLYYSPTGPAWGFPQFKLDPYLYQSYLAERTSAPIRAEGCTLQATRWFHLAGVNYLSNFDRLILL